MKNDFTISDVFSKSWDKFKMYWGTYLVLIIGYMLALLPFEIVNTIWQSRMMEKITKLAVEGEGFYRSVELYLASNMQEVILFVVFWLIYIVWNMVVGYNLVKFSLSIYDGHKYSFLDIFTLPKSKDGSMKNFINYLIIFLLFFVFGFSIAIPFIFSTYYSIASVLHFGLFVWVLALVYIILTYSFSMYIIVDKNKGFREALKISEKITRGVKIKMIGLYLLYGVACLLIVLAGFLALIIGIIPALFIIVGWATFMGIYLYRHLYSAHH